MSRTYLVGSIFGTTILAVMVSMSVKSSLANQPMPNSSGHFATTSSFPPSLDWQKIPSRNLSGVNVYRCQVPGGWLVTTKADATVPFGTGMTFIPDVGHSWIMAFSNTDSTFVPATKINAYSKDEKKAMTVPRFDSYRQDEKVDSVLPVPASPKKEGFKIEKSFDDKQSD